MSKPLSFVIPFAASAMCLFAADFWQSKPFADWSDKDVQRMLLNSPWSKLCVIESGAQTSSTQMRHGNRAGAMNPEAGISSLNLIIRWESAMPVRQAMVKKKFGAEAKTSFEARSTLEAPAEFYIVSVNGVPRADLPHDTEGIKKQMLSQAMLLIKGKDPIKATDFMMRPEGDQNSEGLFAFPKSAPIVEDDKEVEFVARIGELSVRQRFRLKDMLLNGKLEL